MVKQTRLLSRQIGRLISQQEIDMIAGAATSGCNTESIQYYTDETGCYEKKDVDDCYMDA